ncbi:hypothetical protein E2C01_019440 [Portunus trituberculatus]|uniref:Uncharacterized protein n=1 Tax=Portunus trituberculatus TaxID=210409 RepID=A0A5B7DZC8_PORTR|nr:hypothetical protein [Portunus trituberculatus]
MTGALFTPCHALPPLPQCSPPRRDTRPPGARLLTQPAFPIAELEGIDRSSGRTDRDHITRMSHTGDKRGHSLLNHIPYLYSCY